jgi:hypothetical protein
MIFQQFLRIQIGSGTRKAKKAYTKRKCFDEMDGFSGGLQSFPRTSKYFME